MATGGSGKQVLPSLPPEPEVAQVDAGGAGPTKQPLPGPMKTAVPLVADEDRSAEGARGRRRLLVGVAVAVVALVVLVGGALALSGGGDDGETDTTEQAASSGSSSGDPAEDDAAEIFDPSDPSDPANDGGILSDEPWYVGQEIPDGDGTTSGHEALAATLANPDAPSAGTVFLSALTVGTCWFSTDDPNEFESVRCDGDYEGIVFDIFEAPDGEWQDRIDTTIEDCVFTYAGLGLPGLDVIVESSGPAEIQWEEGQRTVRCSVVPMDARFP
jgi:hypothetical protein